MKEQPNKTTGRTKLTLTLASIVMLSLASFCARGHLVSETLYKCTAFSREAGSDSCPHCDTCVGTQYEDFGCLLPGDKCHPGIPSPKDCIVAHYLETTWAVTGICEYGICTDLSYVQIADTPVDVAIQSPDNDPACGGG